MIIEDEVLAKDFLLNVGYYRLGFYWYHFEKNNQEKRHCHSFHEGVRFEDIVSLYKFDKRLLDLIIAYLNDIEFALKTRMIYYVSHAYPNQPAWFADLSVVTAQTCEFVESIYPTFTCNDVLRRHHAYYRNDKFAPAWKTIEFFSFGQLCKVYDGLQDINVKRDISQLYDIRNPIIFSRYLDALRRLRNACAHGHNAYDIALTKPLPSKGVVNIPAEQTPHIGGLIAVMKHFLDNMQRTSPSQFAEKLNALIAEQPPFVKNHIAYFGLRAV